MIVVIVVIGVGVLLVLVLLEVAAVAVAMGRLMLLKSGHSLFSSLERHYDELKPSYGS